MATFEKQEAAHFPGYGAGFPELRRNVQWRSFFRNQQKFRTRCKACIVKDLGKAREEISADEDSDDPATNAPIK